MSPSNSTDASRLAKGGPATQEGRNVVRWNATRHGIRSPVPVVPGVEKKRDWDEHRDGVLESLSPLGHLELLLAERVALLSWRLHRVTRYETEAITDAQESIERDLTYSLRPPVSTYESLGLIYGRIGIGNADPENAGLEKVRDELGHAQAKHRLLKQLPKLKATKRIPGPDADDVLWAVADVADVVAEKVVEPEEVLDNVSIPSIPEGVAWDKYDGWTAQQVRAGIKVIAEATKEDPKELLDAATEAANRELNRAKGKAEEVERDLKTMSRERFLPDDETLQKITRYEAHLSRLLFKTLHEVEALQIRRMGGAAPLARLDIEGLPES